MPRKDKHSKGKEAAHADSWEEWSPWRWDDATQKWYQWRYDETGNVEHNSSTDQLDPRGDAAVEQMTAHLEQTHLSSASEGNENQAYNVYSTPDSSASHAYEQHIPGNPEHPYAPDAQQPVSDAGHAYGHAYEQSYEATYGQTPEAEQVSGLQDPQGSQALLNGDNDYGYDYSVAGIDAGPSYSQAPYDVYDQSHSAADPVSYYNESATPKSTAQRPRKKGREEYMDPQYSLVDSSEFRLGRIVKVWWPEGRGQRQNRQSTVNSRRNYRFDQLTYQGFRRFIIVGTRRGSCVIIPISTYGGQGCVKKGIHPEDHGIIHDHRWSPTPLPEEPQLGTGPVAAEMYGTEETLTDASRVNYAKVHNLEHNVPVWFVGELLPDALEMVQDAVRQRMHESTTGASMNHQRERSDRHRSSRDKSSRDKSDKHKKSKK